MSTGRDVTRSLRTYLVAAALAAVAAPSVAHSQVLAPGSYDRTIFVHGFNVSGNYFLYPGTAGRLVSQGINLGPLGSIAPTRSDTGRGLINDQATEFRSYLNLSNVGGRNVLYGYSLGGLVARKTYLTNPANIAAIVTVATPHGGAPIGDNRDVVPRYLIASYNSTLFDRVIANLILRQNYLDPFLISMRMARDTANKYFGLYTPALYDMRPSSSTITFLKSRTNDAVPHAAVYGGISSKHAIFRLALAGDDDYAFNQAIKQRDKIVNHLNTCSTIGYSLILTTGFASECARVKNIIRGIDVVWDGAFTGYRYIGPIKIPVGGWFDGVVPSDRAAYPGQPLSAAYQAKGANHNNIGYRNVGIEATARAMRDIGMGR